MTHYVLGFAFNTDRNGNITVGLIRKKKPEWQRGRWNGIGGKIEEGETPVAAMVREFKEETGIKSRESDWRYVGVLLRSKVFHTSVFVTENLDITTMVKTTSELPSATPIDWIRKFPEPYIENILAIIELCRVQAAPPSNVIPHFTLDYT